MAVMRVTVSGESMIRTVRPSAVLMLLMDSGKQQELIALLGQFGAAAIPELRPEQYGAFATALRGMGAQI